MSSMIPETRRFRHLNNIAQNAEQLEAMGKKLFGKDFLGYIEELTFIHSEGFITKKIKPIEGTPAKHFSKIAKEVGLIGTKFNDDVNDMTDDAGGEQ